MKPSGRLLFSKRTFNYLLMIELIPLLISIIIAFFIMVSTDGQVFYNHLEARLYHKRSLKSYKSVLEPVHPWSHKRQHRRQIWSREAMKIGDHFSFLYENESLPWVLCDVGCNDFRFLAPRNDNPFPLPEDPLNIMDYFSAYGIGQNFSADRGNSCEYLCTQMYPNCKSQFSHFWKLVLIKSHDWGMASFDAIEIPMAVWDYGQELISGIFNVNPILQPIEDAFTKIISFVIILHCGKLMLEETIISGAMDLFLYPFIASFMGS